MILRLCLKDKSSVLVESSFTDIYNQTIDGQQFVEVTNYKTKKAELYNKDYIWCIRESSENNK